MDYVTIFETEKIYVSTIHIILFAVSAFMIGYVCYAFKHKQPVLERIMATVVCIGFVSVTLWSVITSNAESTRLYEQLQNQTCSVVEGEVSGFNTPSALGHDVESFYINDEFFSYSNSVGPGYSQTKVFGGCVTGNGQKLRISYVTVENMNIILRIEEKI
ncbi:MAG: hypothetical protein NC122_01090 [Faecalibacterium sp.]|nr:hypothetical protein [Ruminococcus sp.]MCM1391243.1 hypothetical protein [Ruminococcus sp.]MCM1484783.1 hypothetical protein [Faecalibacterium sp.]